jgi:putative transposase
MTQVHFTLKQEELQKLLTDHVKDDLARSLLTTLFDQLMEKERDHYIGADPYARGERVSSRNGYYERDFTTRVGTLTLRVPRTRDGKFSTEIFERYERHEKALLASMLEMYIAGVSTRKVSQVVENLCGTSVSKSFVSSLTKDLDEVVQSFQYASLDAVNYPCLMVDVLYLKVREEGRVVSKSCHIALGINEQGNREVLGFLIQEGESLDTWSRFFDYLKGRGLQGVKLVISDAHSGLVQAITKSFTGASWQRCQVHFLRNIFSSIPKKGATRFREEVKTLFKIMNVTEARIMKDEILKRYQSVKGYQTACETLDRGFDDAIQYLESGFPYARLRSTNLLERLNEELRRREKVIRIFPHVQSANRLIGAILMDIHDGWLTSSRSYINL